MLTVTDMARVLPKALVIKKIEDLFCQLNDPCDPQVLDLHATVDPTLSFRENVSILREEYPQFSWVKGEIPTARSYEKEIVADARAQVSDFSYDILKKSKIEGLQRTERRATRLLKKLETCEARPLKRPSRPGQCERKTVEVVSHRRCAPRK